MTKLIFLLPLLFLVIASAHAHKQELDANEKAWFQNVCEGNKETIVKIHLYVQDLLGGLNKTVFDVASASFTSTSPTSFGQVRAVDDLITVGPDYNSEPLGRVQGLITSADLETSALAMNLNFYFTHGEYNGSTISFLGRNQLMNEERELTIVGGTGKFRMARGYAITSTYSYEVETSYGVLEYTLYVAYVEKSDLANRVNKEFNPIRLATE